MKLKLMGLIGIMMTVSACVKQSPDPSSDASCLTNAATQAARSKELKKLFEADIHDRDNWEKMSRKQLEMMRMRDQVRRIRVSEIFAEGCFKTSDDYAEAALIYQHGEVPDHFYQAFIWSNRAVALGDKDQKQMVALTIDRYLVSIGKKQLFGSQAFASQATNWCYCMSQVELTFPDSMRQDYLEKSLKSEYAEIASMNKRKNNCIHLECSDKLKPSPKGSVPGFW